MSASAQTSTLVRQLGLSSAAALVISNMIGTGIFTTSGYLAGDLGHAWLILLIWVVGALCALAGALSYSELGINFPSSGGEYVYLTRAWGPTWGFMTGWTSFFAGFSAPIAAASLAFADYLGYFWAPLKPDHALWTIGPQNFSLRIGGAQLAAIGLIALLTLLNCARLRLVAAVQNLLTATKITVLVAFVILGFLSGRGDWSHFWQTAQRTSSTPLASQFAISLFWIYVAYSGWNAATYVAEELKEPRRTLPLALTLGTAAVAALYLAINIVFIYGASLEEMKGVTAVGSLAAAKLFGPGIAGLFSGLMALSLVSTVNAMVTIGPRVYYAMAKNGAFLPIAARVHPRTHTPVAAILCQGLCAALMTLTPFPQLVLYIGVILNFFAAMSVASLFRLRNQRNWQRLPVVDFAYPLIPAFFVLVALWMTIFGLHLQPKVSLAAIITVVLGALVFRLRMRASAPAESPR